MAFEELPNNRTRSNALTGPGLVTAALWKNNATAPAFGLRIGDDVCAALQWSRGQRIRMLEGSGVDVGVLKMVASDQPNSGYTLNRPEKSPSMSQISISVTQFRHHVPISLNTADIPTEALVFQRFGGELLIMLPTWMQPPPPLGAASNELPQARIPQLIIPDARIPVSVNGAARR